MRIAAPPLPPVQSPATPAGKQATKLLLAWRERYAACQAVESEEAAARRVLVDAQAALTGELERAAQSGKRSAREAEAIRAVNEAREAVEQPWRERLLAQQRVAERARGEYARYVDEHVEQLFGEPEFASEAETAQAAISAALHQLLEAVDARRELAQRINRLLEPVGLLDGADVRGVDPRLERLVSDAAELAMLPAAELAPVPVPTPEVLAWRRDQLAGAPSAGIPAGLGA